MSENMISSRHMAEMECMVSEFNFTWTSVFSSSPSCTKGTTTGSRQAAVMHFRHVFWSILDHRTYFAVDGLLGRRAKRDIVIAIPVLRGSTVTGPMSFKPATVNASAAKQFVILANKEEPAAYQSNRALRE
jgi:hypothetical protein